MNPLLHSSLSPHAPQNPFLLQISSPLEQTKQIEFNAVSSPVSWDGSTCSLNWKSEHRKNHFKKMELKKKAIAIWEQKWDLLNWKDSKLWQPQKQSNKMYLHCKSLLTGWSLTPGPPMCIKENTLSSWGILHRFSLLKTHQRQKHHQQSVEGHDGSSSHQSILQRKQQTVPRVCEALVVLKQKAKLNCSSWNAKSFHPGHLPWWLSPIVLENRATCAEDNLWMTRVMCTIVTDTGGSHKNWSMELMVIWDASGSLSFSVIVCFSQSVSQLRCVLVTVINYCLYQFKVFTHGRLHIILYLYSLCHASCFFVKEMYWWFDMFTAPYCTNTFLPSFDSRITLSVDLCSVSKCVLCVEYCSVSLLAIPGCMRITLCKQTIWQCGKAFHPGNSYLLLAAQIFWP